MEQYCGLTGRPPGAWPVRRRPRTCSVHRVRMSTSCVGHAGSGDLCIPPLDVAMHAAVVRPEAAEQVRAVGAQLVVRRLG